MEDLRFIVKLKWNKSTKHFYLYLSASKDASLVINSDYTSGTGWGWETEGNVKLFATSTSVFLYLKNQEYLLLCHFFFLNRKMRGHGIYGSLQLSKFMRNRCSEESPCRFQLLITRYLGGSSEDSLCPAQTAKRKTEPASNNSKHSGKHLNTQSMFCVCMKANYLNILKGFCVITNTKDFIVS